MNDCKIWVRGEIDIIAARMRVRDQARLMGMDLADQSRISLATSSLAHALNIGEAYTGEIRIETIQNGRRTGLRVICARLAGAPGVEDRVLGAARWMVDDLQVVHLPPDVLQITLIKWADRARGE